MEQDASPVAYERQDNDSVDRMLWYAIPDASREEQCIVSDMQK